MASPADLRRDWLLFALVLHGDCEYTLWLQARWATPDDWLDALEAHPDTIPRYPGALSEPASGWADTLRYAYSVVRLIFRDAGTAEVMIAVAATGEDMAE
jgi:glycine/D-amino acid oxidase-like deaminating enzyme